MYAVNFCDCASVQVQLRQTAFVFHVQVRRKARLRRDGIQGEQVGSGKFVKFVKAFIGRT